MNCDECSYWKTKYEDILKEFIGILKARLDRVSKNFISPEPFELSQDLTVPTSDKRKCLHCGSWKTNEFAFETSIQRPIESFLDPKFHDKYGFMRWWYICDNCQWISVPDVIALPLEGKLGLDRIKLEDDEVQLYFKIRSKK